MRMRPSRLLHVLLLALVVGSCSCTKDKMTSDANKEAAIHSGPGLEHEERKHSRKLARPGVYPPPARYNYNDIYNRGYGSPYGKSGKKGKSKTKGKSAISNAYNYLPNQIPSYYDDQYYTEQEYQIFFEENCTVDPSAPTAYPPNPYNPYSYGNNYAPNNYPPNNYPPNTPSLNTPPQYQYNDDQYHGNRNRKRHLRGKERVAAGEEHEGHNQKRQKKQRKLQGGQYYSPNGAYNPSYYGPYPPQYYGNQPYNYGPPKKKSKKAKNPYAYAYNNNNNNPYSYVSGQPAYYDLGFQGYTVPYGYELGPDGTLQPSCPPGYVNIDQLSTKAP